MTTTPFRALLDALYPLGLPAGTNLTVGRVPVWRINPDQTKTTIHPADWRHIDTFDGADQLIETLVEDHPNRTVYYGVCATIPGLGTGQKGKQAQMAAVPALWLDLDYRTETKTSGATPQQIEALLDELDRLGIPAGALIETGGGQHAYILLDEPAEGEQIAVALDLNRRLHATAQRILGDNVVLDAVGNADRVLRPPGSVRTKNDAIGRTAATVICINPDMRVGLDHLDQTLDHTPPVRVARPVDHDRTLDGLDLARARHDATVSCHDIFAAAGWERFGTDGWNHPGCTVPPSARIIDANTSSSVWPDGVRDMAVIYSGNILTQLGYHQPVRLRSSILATHLLYDGDTTAFIVDADRTQTADYLATFGLDTATDTAERETVARTTTPEPYEMDDTPDDRPPAAAQLIVWGDPDPIMPADTRPAFPVHVFPAVAQTALSKAVTAIGCQPDLVAAAIIGAYSTVGTWARTRVAIGGSTDRVNLWQLVVAPPSAGKSPIFRAFIEKPVEPIEATQRAERITHDRITHGTYKAAVAAADNEERAAAKAGRPVDPDVYRRIPPEPPRTGETGIVSSGTAEAIERYTAECGGALAVVSPEGGLLADLSSYQGTDKGARVTPLLGLYSGDKQTVARVDQTKRRDVPPDARLAQTLAVQPVVAEPLFSNPSFRRTGYLARTMVVWIGDKSIHRNSRVRLTSRDMADYTAHIRQYAETLLSNPDGHTATLSTDAEQAHYECDDLIRAHLETNTAHDEYSLAWEALSKLSDSVLRLAACLHFAHGRSANTPVGRDGILDAWTVGAYWLEHLLFAEAHIAMTQRRGGDEQVRLLMQVARLIAGQTSDEVSPRDVVRATRCEPADAIAALERLRVAGWVATSDDRPVAERSRGWRRGHGQMVVRHPSLVGSVAVLSKPVPSVSSLSEAIESMRRPVDNPVDNSVKGARYVFNL